MKLVLDNRQEAEDVCNTLRKFINIIDKSNFEAMEKTAFSLFLCRLFNIVIEEVYHG